MSKPKNREEFRNQMAEAFINILSEKGLEWKKEWSGIGFSHFNAVTKAQYRGINTLNLYLISKSRGYKDNRWATMLQIMDKEGKYHPNEKWHLKAGSKAAYVEYWYQYDTTNKKAVTWQKYREEIVAGRKPEEFRLCSRYTPVFNASDIEGIPKLELEENPDINIDDIVTKLSDNMKVPILYDGGDRAYYSPVEDKIHLPKKESFTNEYAFNATALHELSHSTGHATRLNRALGGFFGSESYAYEELVAEMCACFMGINLSSAPEIENHKAYVQSWIQTIKDKPETLIKAVKEAQAAALYMDLNAELISREEYINKTNGIFYVSDSDNLIDNRQISESDKKRSNEAFRDIRLQLPDALNNIASDNTSKSSHIFEDNVAETLTAEHRNMWQVIHDYEASVGRNPNDCLVEQDLVNGGFIAKGGVTPEQIEETYNRYREYLRFGKEVDEAINGRMNNRNALKVCNTPQILKDAGCEDLPMLYTQRHLKDALHEKDTKHSEWHGLEPEQIKKIPELLETPVMLYDSLTRKDSLIAVLLDKDKDNMPLVISIRPNGYGQYNFERVENNFITSIYGRNKAESHFQTVIQSGNLLFIDKKRSQALCNLLQVQFPQGLQQSDFNIIIHKSSHIVKSNSAPRKTEKAKDAKPFYNVQRLKEIPIAEVAEELGIEVIRRGNSAWCKIRNERDPSCKLYETTNTFCDFGSMASGDTVNFVAEVKQISNAEAIEALANLFNIAPERNIKQGNYIGELTNSQYAKIGIAGEMATMNMDIDVEKQGIEQTISLTAPYRITMNELRVKHPEAYSEIMRNRAIPYIYSERQEYYTSIWCQDMLSKEFNVDLKQSPDINGEFRLKAAEMNNKEKLLLSALKGTDINYKPRKYDFEADIEKIRTGKIQFEIGNVEYSALKRSDTAVANALEYKSMPVKQFLEAKPNLGQVDYAAFVKGDNINLAFRKSDKPVIDKALKPPEQDHDKNRNIKR